MGAASFRKVLLVSSAQQRKSSKILRQPIPHNTTVLLEHQIATIEAAGLAARIQAAAKYLNKVFPRGESLWAEQAH